MFNCLILSATPVIRKLPKNIKVINEVSVFKCPADSYTARLHAISKVAEPAFFFLDYDDEYKDMAYFPATMKIGVENWVNKQAGFNITKTVSNYSLAKHLVTPQLVHSAWTVNTEKARFIVEKMPKSGAYYFEHMFTYMFIKEFGFEHEPKLKYQWEIFSSGLHKQFGELINNTVEFLKNLESK